MFIVLCARCRDASLLFQFDVFIRVNGRCLAEHTINDRSVLFSNCFIINSKWLGTVRTLSNALHFFFFTKSNILLAQLIFYTNFSCLLLFQYCANQCEWIDFIFAQCAQYFIGNYFYSKFYMSFWLGLAQ